MNNKPHSKRNVIIFLVLLSLFAICYCKLFYDQVVKGNDRKVMAERQYEYIKDIDEEKYLLLDRNGKNLQDYTIKYYAVIDQFIYSMFNDDSNNSDLALLKYILKDYNINYNLPDISSAKTNNELSYEIDKETYDKLKEVKDVKGFYTYTYTAVDRSDTWKIENLISNTKRTSDNSDKDKDSLEMEIYNRVKNDESTKIVFQRGKDESIVDQSYDFPQNNVNVRLTLDKNIEDSIYGILNSDKYSKYQQIGVVLMDSESGKLLAVTQKNNRLPNINIAAGTEDGFEPGSIFKTIVLETGIDMGKISLSDTFDCTESPDSLCKETHGWLTVDQAYCLSCNNDFAYIGKEVGFNNFIDMAKKQGLFNKVLNFDSEVKGDYVEPNYSAGGERLVSIGQNMRITPIQAISIVNTIVNGGKYVKPSIIDAYVDDNNNVIESAATKETSVIKESTATIMKNEMLRVVSNGTAYEAAIKGMEIGGKTGTNQRQEKLSDGTIENHSDGWFIGFFNVNGKYYTATVFVKDIDVVNESAGNTAVPIFRDVVQAVKKYL